MGARCPILVAILLHALGLAAPASGQEAQTCIGDWSEAGPIVRREGLASMERVGRLARDRAGVAVVTSALCKSGEGYVYRLLVRGDRGQLNTLVVDARQPFGP